MKSWAKLQHYICILTFDPDAVVVLLLDYLCLFMKGKDFYRKVPILVLAGIGEEFISDLHI